MSSEPTIQFTGNISITDAIRDFTYKKFSHLKQHNKNISDVHLIFEVNNQRHKATAKVNLAHKGTINASEETDDLYASIEAVVHNLKQQLSKIHDKETEHR